MLTDLCAPSSQGMGWEARRGEFETEMYVYYGTNDYNFQKLPDPPRFEPTLCDKCGRRVVLSDVGYTQMAGTYICMSCSGPDLQRLLRGVNRSKDAEA